MFDLAKLAETKTIKILPLSALDGMAPDGTESLLTGHAVEGAPATA